MYEAERRAERRDHKYGVVSLATLSQHEYGADKAEEDATAEIAADWDNLIALPGMRYRALHNQKTLWPLFHSRTGMINGLPWVPYTTGDGLDGHCWTTTIESLLNIDLNTLPKGQKAQEELFRWQMQKPRGVGYRLEDATWQESTYAADRGGHDQSIWVRFVTIARGLYGSADANRDYRDAAHLPQARRGTPTAKLTPAAIFHPDGEILSALCSQETAHELAAERASLSDADKQLLQWAVEEKRSQADIGQQLGLSRQAVGKRVRKLLATFRNTPHDSF